MGIYRKNQKTKNIILIISLVILLFIIAIAVLQDNMTYDEKYKIITSSRVYNKDIISKVQINEMNCAYDSESNTWFFSQDIKDKGINVLMKTGVISDLYNVKFITNKESGRNRG